MGDEFLEVVDESGRILGLAPRSVVHADPSLLHRTVHVIVNGRAGGILLQRRSAAKDTAPGLWDTSVGGHAIPGEDPLSAALRELEEELGIPGDGMRHLYEWVYRGSRESELITTFRLVHGGPFKVDAREIDEVSFWPLERIDEALGTGVFSAQFEEEYRRYREWLSSSPSPP